MTGNHSFPRNDSIQKLLLHGIPVSYTKLTYKDHTATSMLVTDVRDGLCWRRL